MTEAALRTLHDGLTERAMPETVARTILDLRVVRQDPSMVKLIEERATGRKWRYSMMSDGWFQPVVPSRKIKTALDIFQRDLAKHPEEAIAADEADPERIRRFVAFLSGTLARNPGQTNFKDDRLNRAGRKMHGLGHNNHAYNKRWRHVVRLEEQTGTYTGQMRLLGYRVAGKAGLVSDIPFERFSASPWAAAFVAYYAAQKKRRSQFTNTSQERPFDTVCEALMKRCEADPHTDWGLIARVYPEPAVLKRLDDQQKGDLMGAWTNLLVEMSADLERCWKENRFDLDDMIVERGNDSSTWNITAQAWNTARTAWMSFLAALGQDSLLTECLPGKVMRLIAADVARWHRMSGGGLHPDTIVWRKLPKPWQVLRGEAKCTREMVEKACREAGVDPVKSGWIEAQVSKTAVAFKPTPELVHGVTVSSPFLALIFRRAGVFSGKTVKLPSDV